jgi:hypothetical protein
VAEYKPYRRSKEPDPRLLASGSCLLRGLFHPYAVETKELLLQSGFRKVKDG